MGRVSPILDLFTFSIGSPAPPHLRMGPCKLAIHFGVSEGLDFVSPDVSHWREGVYELYEVYERAYYRV